jgi:DNA-binding NarL/FixJ family response regulator
VTGAAPTVVIADDHQVTRIGVRMTLLSSGFSVVGEAEDAEGAVRAALSGSPDVCLLDVAMPGGGISAARHISRGLPATAIVMLSVSMQTAQVLAALRAGAVGYLPKDTRPDRLAAAVRGVLAGEAALPRAVVRNVLDELTTPRDSGSLNVRGVRLTPRESEIVTLLRSGLSTAEVGEALSLSPVTVRRHVSAVVAKLGVADRNAALETVDPEAA